uniref:Uncharacterized protein n=1 Tax=Anguilla anguilla TaxID=7936 RepID=A0A0E9VAA9_ANGAN
MYSYFLFLFFFPFLHQKVFNLYRTD